MPQLRLQRVRFSVEADTRLKMLKARTGITPNILCRLGFCLSLAEPGAPVSDASDLSTREINRYTLLGEYDRLLASLLQLRHPDVRGDGEDLDALFIQHLHRGIALLFNRVKSPASLVEVATAASGGSHE